VVQRDYRGEPDDFVQLTAELMQWDDRGSSDIISVRAGRESLH
jgi:hypothetical protein